MLLRHKKRNDKTVLSVGLEKKTLQRQCSLLHEELEELGDFVYFLSEPLTQYAS